MKDKTYTTGDLARAAGITTRAVRHYEEEKLLHTGVRLPGRHRLFDENQLKRLLFITKMRELSFPLDVIRRLLEARNACECPAEAAGETLRYIDEFVALLRTKLETLETLKTDLQKTRETITQCVHCDESWQSKDCEGCNVRLDQSPPDLVSLLW